MVRPLINYIIALYILNIVNLFGKYLNMFKEFLKEVAMDRLCEPEAHC